MIHESSPACQKRRLILKVNCEQIFRLQKNYVIVHRQYLALMETTDKDQLGSKLPWLSHA